VGQFPAGRLALGCADEISAYCAKNRRRFIGVVTFLSGIVLAPFSQVNHDSLFEGFVRYRGGRIVDQQQVIANTVAVDSEQRLGKTL
jgi:hypothetical protein